MSYVDVAFVIGDCINGYPSHEYIPSWGECVFGWSCFNKGYERLNVSMYKNIVVGNHDLEPYLGGVFWRSWFNMSPLVNGFFGNYTYQLGNILFVVLGCEYADVGGGHYREQFSWFRSVVENNSDKNIIVLSHYPLFMVYGTCHGLLFQTNYMNASDSWLYYGVLNCSPWVCLWANGHIHTHSRGYILNGSCFFFDVDCINYQSRCWSSFMGVMNQSKDVRIRFFNHLYDLWYLYPVNARLFYVFNATMES